MSALGYLLMRQLIMILVLTTLGVGPASFMRPTLGWTIRLLLAPAFGLAAGTSIFTTLIWFFPAGRTYWLIPLFGLASCGVAVWRANAIRNPGAIPPQAASTDPAHVVEPAERPNSNRLVIAALQVAAVAVLVLAPTTGIIAYHHSAGPVAFRIDDVDGYVAETDAMQHESLHALEVAPGPWSNPVLAFADGYARQPQNLDFAPLSANVNSLFHWGSSETQSGFLLAVMLAGGLGMSAALIYAMRRRSRLVVISGGVFGGVLLTQLFFDGSQAAICGLVLMLPLAVVAFEVLQYGRLADQVLLALLLAGLLAIYPLFVPGFVLAAAIVLITLAVRAFLKPQQNRARALATRARTLLVIALCAGAFDVVALRRDLRYWQSVLHGGFVGAGDPRYALNVFTIPGWLVQSRGTYVLDLASHSLLSDLLFAALIPLLVLAIIIIGNRRNKFAWLLSSLILGYGLLAGFSGSRHISGTTLSCSYCVDRTLLPLGPVIGFLAVLGVGTLIVSGNALVRRGTLAATAVVLLGTGYTLANELRLLSNQSFFLDTSVSSVLNHYPKGAGPLELEGFDEGLNAPAEQVIVADETEEHFWGDISLPADFSDNRALLYMGSQPLSDPQFRPNYSYVLTRFPGVATNRQVVARSGGIALERRRQGLDVLVDSGLLVGSLQGNPSGQAAVNPWYLEPIRFIVSGNLSPTSSVSVTFRADQPADLVAISTSNGRGLSVYHGRDSVQVCLEPAGTGAVRVVGLTVKTTPYVYLTSVKASTSRCQVTFPEATASATTAGSGPASSSGTRSSKRAHPVYLK